MIVLPLGSEVLLGDTIGETVDGGATGLHESESSLLVDIVSFCLNLQQEMSGVSSYKQSFSLRRTPDSFDCAPGKYSRYEDEQVAKVHVLDIPSISTAIG